MANAWEKFNKAIDTEGLIKDMLETGKNGGERKDVPWGTYEVKIEKLDLIESKSSGNPMISCWMRILEGEFKNSIIFMNQTVHTNYPLSIANDFLRSLGSNVIEKTADKFNQIDITNNKEARDRIFNDYIQYGNLLMDVLEELDGKFEYSVEYGEEKGFKTYKIIDVYVLED